MSVLGHRSLAEAEKYCKAANQAKLAEQAFQQMEVKTKTKTSN